jgi:hypothetical protein
MRTAAALAAASTVLAPLAASALAAVLPALAASTLASVVLLSLVA